MFSDNRSCRPKQTRGFTLIEFLMALGIAGVIAAMLYPAIMQNVGLQKKQAVFKETIQTLTQLLDSGIANDSFTYISGTGGLNWTSYFLSNLNATVTCPVDSATDYPACWNSAVQGSTVGCEWNQPGVILPNGAAVVGFDNDNGIWNGIIIDWNGQQGPNNIGNDQLYVDISGTPATITPAFVGTCGMTAAQATANTALFNWVMQPNH
jgi:prepilin-type N-terminal cleavage/methylation domain-containing protein